MTSAPVSLGGIAIRPEPVAALALAFTLDVVVGEPPERVHPVAIFGRAIAALDREWPAPRLAGVAIAVVAPLAVATLAWASVDTLAELSPLAPLLAGALLFSTSSARRLVVRVAEVIDATETDPEQAREAIPALVGRDPTSLSPAQLRSAAVESLAENLADGFVAPLVAFCVGAQVSLAAGVAVAVWVKAVNTLDSMLGYHGKPIGWASARLDDLVMWVPARATAGLLAVAGRDLGALRRARRWRDAPPSPNSGWPMAALAAVLDARLEKPGGYVLNPDAALPDGPTAKRAVPVGVTTSVFAGALAILSVGVVPC